MGFDLTGVRPSDKRGEYYRASIDTIILLRRAMVTAGVEPKLVYHKFVGNDGLKVTNLQAKSIAEQLATWLKHRSLVVDLRETDEAAVRSNNAYRRVFSVLGLGGHASRSRRQKVIVDRTARKLIRGFAEFCHSSGGFWVD